MDFCPKCDNSFDITQTIRSAQKGGSKEGELIERIKNKEATSTEIEAINLEEFLKNPVFRDLSNDEKEEIYNIIQDLLPNEKKKIFSEKYKKLKTMVQALFLCKNCSYHEDIKEGTVIFSKTSDKTKASGELEDYSDMLYCSFLPHTRRYTCPNSKCESHKDPVKRDAIFFHLSGKYVTIYICTTCTTQFTIN